MKNKMIPDYPIMYKMNFTNGRLMKFQFDDFLFLYVYSGEGTMISGIEAGVDNNFRANQPLPYLKIQECINVLTYLRPGLHNWFSRMNSLQRINLKDFMECHYQDNLPLEQLAQASGRSLSTFRRDFLKVFGTTLGKWLLTKRLEEAYVLIKEKKIKPSEFLLDLGFESFSHFSHSFKAYFGIQPSILLKESIVK